MCQLRCGQLLVCYWRICGNNLSCLSCRLGFDCHRRNHVYHVSKVQRWHVVGTKRVHMHPLYCRDVVVNCFSHQQRSMQWLRCRYALNYNWRLDIRTMPSLHSRHVLVGFRSDVPVVCCWHMVGRVGGNLHKLHCWYVL